MPVPKIQKLFTELITAAQAKTLFDNQLRNLSIVLNQPMPKRKEDKIRQVLAGYQQRASDSGETYEAAYNAYQKQAVKEDKKREKQKEKEGAVS